MILYYFIAAYLLLSTAVGAVCAFVSRRRTLFKPMRSRGVYYFLSFTWGLPVTLAGLLTAFVLVVCGKKPQVIGWNIYFRFNNTTWGASLGLVCLVPSDASEHVVAHEHGHSFQNAKLGLFMPTVVNLPSSARFLSRRIKRAVTKKYPKKSYDSVWFERSASLNGKEFFVRLTEKQKINNSVKMS